MGVLRKLKRGVAKARVASRKRQQSRLEALRLERNKAIKEAKLAEEERRLRAERDAAKAKKQKAKGASGAYRVGRSLQRGASALGDYMFGKPKRKKKSSRR